LSFDKGRLEGCRESKALEREERKGIGSTLFYGCAAEEEEEEEVEQYLYGLNVIST
jgi:hypothetical protein